MVEGKYSVTIVAEKVMPYRCALYRRLAAQPEIELKVLFLDRWGVEPRFDPTMGATYDWGPDVASGFDHQFLENRSTYTVTYTGADRAGVEYRMGALGSMLYYVRTFLALINPRVIAELARSKSPFVIVENYSSLSSLLAIVASRCSGKLVFLRGEASLRRGHRLPLRVLKRLYLRTLFRMFSGFMYSCQSNKDFCLNYGAKESQLVFVPSAVDTSVFASPGACAREAIRRELRKEHGITDAAFVVLGVGRLVVRKNWDEAIEALALASRSCSRLVFFLVGDGPDAKRLRAYAARYPELDARFVGFLGQADVARYYHMADCLIQTSTYDPSPKVLNECLEAGLPMIVSDAVGTAGDVCVDGRNGFVYGSGDICALASCVTRLAESPATRRSFREACADIGRRWSLEVGVRNIVQSLERFATQR